jgi:protein O-mannosyl-transferase
MRPRPLLLLAACMLLTILAYIPGLYGGFILDDFPNIVDNPGVQPANADLPRLISAALSSPSSDLKRPLTSLSFAANYLISGLDPFWMKLTNLVIHLLNGLLAFLLANGILRYTYSCQSQPSDYSDKDTWAALIAGAWLLLPINLTGVLYVVQRMESLANLFVLLGLWGYVDSRERMLSPTATRTYAVGWRGFCRCAVSILIPTSAGLSAKETAALLPLYALVIEWSIFRFRKNETEGWTATKHDKPAIDRRIASFFLIVILLPMTAGLAWLLPHALNPTAWANRNFGLGTRLLSEARVVVDYVTWTIFPSSHALSFYHDDFPVSSSLFAPWTTSACILLIAGTIALLPWLRSRQPLTALGIALFLGAQTLTATIIPLELVYEHRNYFASFGLLLAIAPLLISNTDRYGAIHPSSSIFRYALYGTLIIWWTSLTAFTAYAWGDPLRLAKDLASRAPNSPRAQYELGRTYIIYSKYQPDSPYINDAYSALEKAAALPESSILPQQALIFMNARMHLPLKQVWWDSMIEKLRAHKPGVQDESSLLALVQCARELECDLPKSSMTQAFQAALSYPNPSARLLAMYGDYAWNVLNDRTLGEEMTREAVAASPREPAYLITLARMYIAQGKWTSATQTTEALRHLNIGGNLDGDIMKLQDAMK